MHDVGPARLSSLRPFFTPERPGPLIWAHLLHTGIGRARADRLPGPRAVHVALPDNHALRGDPEAIDPAALADLTGFVEAPPEWLAVLRRVDPGTAVWDRIVAVLPDTAVPPEPRGIRRLTAEDGPALAGLDPEIAWISETWGGPAGLAGSGTAWAAFTDGLPVSVAAPFFVGEAHEDLGVVTARGHRGRGLSTACAAGVIADIRARGRRPTWTTSPDNAGSRAVAARLGFVRQREDVLYAVRAPIPVD